MMTHEYATKAIWALDLLALFLVIQLSANMLSFVRAIVVPRGALTATFKRIIDNKSPMNSFAFWLSEVNASNGNFNEVERISMFCLLKIATPRELAASLIGC